MDKSVNANWHGGHSTMGWVFQRAESCQQDKSPADPGYALLHFRWLTLESSRIRLKKNETHCPHSDLMHILIRTRGVLICGSTFKPK